MCTGAEIALVAGTLASAGGSYMNSQQAAKNQQAKINARNAAAAQEQERQKIFQANNDATVNKSLTDLSKEKQEESFGDLVTKREQAYEANTPAASEFANISDTTPDVVKGDLARKVADKMAASKNQAKALAKIGGTTDIFQNNGLGINQAANQIGTQNNLARGSLQTNLAEQTAAANNAGNKRSTFGDLLQFGGAAASMYGAGAGGFADLFGAGTAATAGTPVANPEMWAGFTPSGLPIDTSTYAAAPIAPW